MNRRVPPLNLNITTFHSVEAFRALVTQLDTASHPILHLQATALAELCAAVLRDLGYLEHILEDVKPTLKMVASYHEDWTDQVREAARRSLNQVDSYIAAKIPSTSQPMFSAKDLSSSAVKSKLSETLKDVASVAALQQQLMAAHAGLLGALRLAYQLAFRHDDAAEVLPEEQRNIQVRYSVA